MYTLILMICSLGFFCLYNSSSKVKLSTAGNMEIWLQSHQQQAKLSGLAFILLSFICLVWMDGAVMGVLHFLLMVMAVGCYIIGLAPFRIIRRHHIVALATVAILLEILIF